MSQLTIGDCVKSGWEGFRKNAGTAVGIVVIYGLITSIGGAIPVVNLAVSIVLTPVLSAGLSIFALKEARGEEGRIEDLFQGFSRLGSFMGAYWLIVAMVLSAVIPAGILFLVDVGVTGNFGSPISYAAAAVGAGSFIILVIALIRFSMVYYLIIDGMQVIDAFRESARITKGVTGTLFLLALVCGLIVLLGVLLIFVGLLAAMPVAMITFAAAYTRLRREASSRSTGQTTA